ncbi:MAG: Membrane carboxypeptidase/penicillin-binding protein [Candidatus Midichloria mitochondrii]|uniref:Penicillin-binding protein 1A n=1 Tax=Midichloria mitochondrii (strain IricVA) TaxID=696127 RepID=F7XVZ6_MIDMI|nr:penicillin-binding protein 1a [Candidatus Midichloria mitochondrii IricVA]MDJ1256540.1 PBP1A family penicillin-binding protein [Candidatus Midichloria mitochondrii]MDJ1288255.1 PBP1A family penicillin-binding protein [Candidatus Midichloria mitochondrii]MDJ1299092.1 PBP1A family penicillin-binding protein [Candidatus Midichloria mitochondrii]MDJ1583825.1 PBP1A family penicillin-binding protein [Candidatus Midichloria mitochondrii]
MFSSLLNIISRWTAFIFILFIVGIAGAIQAIVYFSKGLPDYKQLENYDPPIISRIYSGSGEIMAEYANERRIYVEYKQVPDLVISAFLAAEDKNFFRHQGIDIYSLLRATVQSTFNIITNKRAIGGSTITQQVVKSFLLGNERTLARKIKEAILAYRISKIYSKERVLELYLNQIFFGSNSYGIAAAAQSYFDKELNALNVPEAAMLAALPKAPSALNPFLNYDRAKGRRDWVIERMAEEKFISNREAVKFAQMPIELNKKEIAVSWTENFYIDAVKKELVNLFGEEALYTRGLIVNTYFNEDLQKKAEEAFREGIINYDRRHGWRGPIAKLPALEDWDLALRKVDKPDYIGKYEPAVILGINKESEIKIGCVDKSVHIIPFSNFKWARYILSEKKEAAKGIFKSGDVILVSRDRNGIYHLAQVPLIDGAMVVMEPNSGRVFALIGGYDFTRSYFNRAIQAKRQPGSAFKTFVYLAALEEGYPPNAMILDDPITVSQGQGMPNWQPKNFGGQFFGLMTLRTALEKSRNIPTVRIILELGIEKIVQTAMALKIYNQPRYNYSVALGASETTLMDMTNAYNIIASQGMETRPKLIDSVYDRKGNLLYKDYDMKCINCISNDINSVPEIKYVSEPIISEDVNYQLTSLLNGAMRRGTGARSNILKKTLAGKTGTTNNSHDAWFIGFTPYITAGTYIGYDIPRDMGQRETGSTVSLPIFIDFMQAAVNDLPDVSFKVPKNIILRKIDRHSGKFVEDYNSIDYKDVILEAFQNGNFQDKSFSSEKSTNRHADYNLRSIVDSLDIEDETNN